MMTFDLMANLTVNDKLYLNFILVMIHIYGISICKKAEKLSELETKEHVTKAKDTSSHLQKILEKSFIQLTPLLPAEDTLDIRKAINKVIQEASIISRYEYPYIAKLLISVFKNGALFASFVVCCSNLLLLVCILLCYGIMLPCPQIFEQLKEVFHIAAYVLLVDIVTQAYNLNRIQNGSLISSEICSWISKLDELVGVINLLHSNSELLRNYLRHNES